MKDFDSILLPIQRHYERLVAVVEQAGASVTHYYSSIHSSWEVSRRMVSFSVRVDWDDNGESEEVLYVDTNIGFAHGYEYLGLAPGEHDPSSLVCCCAIESGLGEHLLQMPVRLLPAVAEGRERELPDTEREFRVAAEVFVADAIDFLEEHQSFMIRYIHDGIPSEA